MRGIFFTAACLFCLAGTVRWWGRLFFPFPYRAMVEGQARKRGVDPLLVLALIREESSFDPAAVSPRGALGLMQVMPETGQWIAGQLGEDYAPGRLFVPADNICFGTWYLAALLAEFQGDLVKALIAYNAGSNRVRAWLAGKAWDGTLAGLGEVPFAESRRYVLKILRSYQVYRYLYGERRPAAPGHAGGRGALTARRPWAPSGVST